MFSIKRMFFATVLLFLGFFLPLNNIYSQQPWMACECEQHYGPSELPSLFVEPRFPHVEKELPPAVVVQPPQPVKVIRAAIDIGSGATKLRVAEVNLKTHKIEKILINESFPVQYQEQLSKNANNSFDEQVMLVGLDAIKKSKQIAMENGAQKVIAVATASFRKAENSQAFIDKIYQETGVRVFVIDQELEGMLAFNAVLAQENYDPAHLIVWDIGGGSLQKTAKHPVEDYQIYRGETASIHFKNMIVNDIQLKNINVVTTPNPMTAEEIHKGVLKARELAQDVDQIFKDRILQPNAQIVGVGNIFAYGIYPIVGKKSPFTQQELYEATMNMAHKDDKQLGGGDYANVQLSNAILILGYMQALNIQKMDILDINNADGALLYADFWN